MRRRELITLLGGATDPTENYARAAVFGDKILRGAKPMDLPVERPTKIELLINPKAAKALGLAVSPARLPRTDGLIE